jgi:hypothetical protein
LEHDPKMSKTFPDKHHDNNGTNDEHHEPRSFLSKKLLLLWDYAVSVVVEFIVAVLSHPKVQECLNHSIAGGCDRSTRTSGPSKQD